MSYIPHKIIISKNGFLEEFYTDDGIQIFKSLSGDRLLKSLRYECSLDKDLTLRDICIATENHPKLKEIIGYYSLSLSYIDKCNYEIIHGQEKSENIEYLEIYKIAENLEDDESYLSFYSGFSGIGFEDIISKDRISYGLMPCGYKEYGGLNVILNNKVSLLNYSVNNKNQTVPFTTLCETTCDFSLLDILSTIYYDLTFFGD